MSRVLPLNHSAQGWGQTCPTPRQRAADQSWCQSSGGRCGGEAGSGGDERVGGTRPPPPVSGKSSPRPSEGHTRGLARSSRPLHVEVWYMQICKDQATWFLHDHGRAWLRCCGTLFLLGLSPGAPEPLKGLTSCLEFGDLKCPSTATFKVHKVHPIF